MFSEFFFKRGMISSGVWKIDSGYHLVWKKKDSKKDSEKFPEVTSSKIIANMTYNFIFYYLFIKNSLLFLKSMEII